MTVFENFGLGHVCIVVKDMEKSLAFYRDALGMYVIEDKELPNETNPGKDLDMAVMEHNVSLRLVSLFDGRSALELQEWRYPPVKESPPEFLKYRTTGLKEVAWNVPDLDKLIKDLDKKGYKPRTSIWSAKLADSEVRNILYFDPDGVTVQFTEVPAGLKPRL